MYFKSYVMVFLLIGSMFLQATEEFAWIYRWSNEQEVVDLEYSEGFFIKTIQNSFGTIERVESWPIVLEDFPPFEGGEVICRYYVDNIKYELSAPQIHPWYVFQQAIADWNNSLHQENDEESDVSSESSHNPLNAAYRQLPGLDTFNSEENNKENNDEDTDSSESSHSPLNAAYRQLPGLESEEDNKENNVSDYSFAPIPDFRPSFRDDEWRKTAKNIRMLR